MALSTDSVLRTGPFDHTGKKPKDDEEGEFLFDLLAYMKPNRSLWHDTNTSHRHTPKP
jgi:hypothetical protein